MVPLDEVRSLIQRDFTVLGRSEEVPIGESPGRVTSHAVFARFSVPGIHLAAMDGIAVRSSDTHLASDQAPVTITDAVRVNTGNVIPPGYDAVIMIEDVWTGGDGYTIRRAVSPWQHIRPAGEDIGESEMILPSFHRIRPHETGALATYGIIQVPVLSVRVALLPTGSELVAPGTRPGPGQVVESNTVMAAVWLSDMGASCVRLPVTPDEPAAIRDAILSALPGCDVLIISAGSSAGTKDYTAQVVGELGEVLVHGVAIKPGKPVIIGRIAGKPVIGMPGYPLSALTVLREIITPLMVRFGLPAPGYHEITARLTMPVHSDAGIDEFILLSTGKVGGGWVATPLSRGAGVQMSAVRANALLKVPVQIEGHSAGDEVPIRLLVPYDEASASLLVTGSHDPALDHLCDLLAPCGIRMHSSHVGSMGGILALRKGECHAAPTHLLSPDGDFNRSFITSLIPDREVTLVTVAGRQQGIVSRDGLGLGDITRSRFINRQRGSGTRMLLDQVLASRHIPPSAIEGYDREAMTHLAVALAVRTGEADIGMCVFSAARALGLSFEPVADERYELAIRSEDLSDERVARLVSTISSPEFRQRLEALGGYDTTITGTIRRVPG